MRTPVRRSAAGALAAAPGAVFVEEAGWEIPASYGDDEVERAVIRGRVALADVTARAKVDVRGRVHDLPPLPADAVVARIASDQVLALGGPGTEVALMRAIEPSAGSGAMVTDATHLFAGFALAGPEIGPVLERTTSWNPATLAVGAATAAPIADVRAVLVNRDLRVPVLELYVATEHARYVWEELASVVAGLGGRPVGWQALRAEGWG